MPQFLDPHPRAHTTLTEEAVEELRKHIRAETPDDFRVKWLSICDSEQGRVMSFGSPKRGSGG